MKKGKSRFTARHNVLKANERLERRKQRQAERQR